MSRATPQKFQSEDQRRGRHPAVRFTISVPGSENSSRASSRASSPLRNGAHLSLNDGFAPCDAKAPPSPGCRSADAYDATLPWWRAAVRRKLLVVVQRESNVIARMQVCAMSLFFLPSLNSLYPNQDIVRRPWLDTYFVYTSSLGTHTFFMTALPALFFFGYDEMGRG